MKPETIESNTNLQEQIEARDLTIQKLYSELGEKVVENENLIKSLNKTHTEIDEYCKNTKLIYYIGFILGIVGIVIGLHGLGIFSFLCGIALIMTTGIGLLEAKRNGW